MKHSLDGPVCASVDHQYWNYFVVWCPHFQQYTLRATLYLETGTSADPVNLQNRSLELGPFDNGHDVLHALTTWLNDDWGGTGG